MRNESQPTPLTDALTACRVHIAGRAITVHANGVAADHARFLEVKLATERAETVAFLKSIINDVVTSGVKLEPIWARIAKLNALSL